MKRILETFRIALDWGRLCVRFDKFYTDKNRHDDFFYSKALVLDISHYNKEDYAYKKWDYEFQMGNFPGWIGVRLTLGRWEFSLGVWKD